MTGSREEQEHGARSVRRLRRVRNSNGVLNSGRHRRGGGSGGGLPWEYIFVEVYLRCEYNTGYAGHEDVVRTRCSKATSQVHADQGTWFDAGLRVRVARFDGKSSVAEWQYGHDARFHSRERLVRRHAGVRRSRGAIKHVDGVRHRVSPERRWRPAGNKVGSSELHYAADCAFRHAVQLVYMRRARCGVNAFISEELGELFREEFTRLSLWSVPTFVEQCGESG
eukprot:1330124-Pleurochrysis_carterae.AAC.3